MDIGKDHSEASGLQDALMESISRLKVFDASWYLERNPDVAAAGLNPLAHYLASGASEGRHPHPLFDASWYYGKYPDVAESDVNPLIHYLYCGSSYGTEPHPLFHGAWYLSKYSRVRELQINPLVHYICNGANENCDPSPNFSTSWYRHRYFKDDTSQINPLVHYVLLGKRENYLPIPLSETYKKISWLQRTENINEIFEINRHISLMLSRPFFFIFINCTDKESAKYTIESVNSQLYPDRSFFFDREDFIKNIDIILSGKTPECCFFIWLECGDILHNAALYHFASAINRFPDIDLFYGDEEVFLEAEHSIVPFFKPDWSPDYLENFNYIGQAAAYRVSKIIPLICAATSAYDLLLQSTEEQSMVLHLREILIRSNDRKHLPSSAINAECKAIEARLHRSSRCGSVTTVSGSTALYRITVRPDPDVRVSIILYDNPKFGKKDLSQIKKDVNFDTLLIDQNIYSNLEIINVNLTIGLNAVREINSAARDSSGDILFFLRRELQPSKTNWLNMMLSHSEKPRVGAVGAKLRCQQTGVQYTGVVSVNGDPHYIKQQAYFTDYFFSTSAVRNFKAISAQCLMTKRDTFELLGGFNEDIPDFFSKIDYCYRASDIGFYNICDPNAEFIIDLKDYKFQNQHKKTFFLEDKDSGAEFFSGSVITDPFYNTDRLSIYPVNYDPRLDHRLGMDL